MPSKKKNPLSSPPPSEDEQVISLSVTPIAELPVWGRRVEFDDYFVELVPQGERIFNVRLQQAFASINFGPAEGTSSLAGDRLRRYERRPFEYIVAPPRFPLKGETTLAPEVLVFVFDFDKVRTVLSTVVGVTPDNINPQVVIGNPAPFTTTLAKKIRKHLTNDTLSRDYLGSLCTVLLLEMCRTIAKHHGAKRRSPIGDGKMGMLLKYIDANLDNDLAVDHLAELVGASPDQLSRAFKKSVGESPHNYVLLRRTDAARNLLRDATSTLAQVAYATGFSSQSHMTTAFKKVLGVTPGAIRAKG